VTQQAQLLAAIGRCLRQERERRGLDLKAIAGPARTSPQHLARIEDGLVNPAFCRLYALVTVGLQIDFGTFMERVENAQRAG
jgi:transcriptional regulator with XRE-family HTH domain